MSEKSLPNTAKNQSRNPHEPAMQESGGHQPHNQHEPATQGGQLPNTPDGIPKQTPSDTPAGTPPQAPAAKRRRAAVAAAVVAAFLGGLFIPSPLFYLAERLGGSRIFLAKDTVEMIMPDGSVYEGTVNALNGRFDGYGVLKSRGAGYIGRWRNGRLLFGKLTTPQMSYEGRFDNGLDVDGFGIVRYSDDHIDSLRAAGIPDSAIIAVYVGNMKRNLRNGLGRAVMADSTMLFGVFRDGEPVRRSGGYRTGERVYGIDISHFQSRLDWDDFALFCDSTGYIGHEAPVDSACVQPVFFVYIKATEGAAYKDPTFASNMLEARRHGIARGAYHFLRLKGRVEEQTVNFTSTARWRPGDLPPMLDVEQEEEILALGEEASRDFIHAWLTDVEARMDVRPMIYTTDKIRDLYLKPDPRFDGYDYWMARYSRHEPHNGDWTLWQFTDRGLLNGCDIPLDLDLYNDDLPAFDRYLRRVAGIGD